MVCNKLVVTLVILFSSTLSVMALDVTTEEERIKFSDIAAEPALQIAATTDTQYYTHRKVMIRLNDSDILRYKVEEARIHDTNGLTGIDERQVQVCEVVSKCWGEMVAASLWVYDGGAAFIDTINGNAAAWGGALRDYWSNDNYANLNAVAQNVVITVVVSGVANYYLTQRLASIGSNAGDCNNNKFGTVQNLVNNMYGFCSALQQRQFNGNKLHLSGNDMNKDDPSRSGYVLASKMWVDEWKCEDGDYDCMNWEGRLGKVCNELGFAGL